MTDSLRVERICLMILSRNLDSQAAGRVDIHVLGDQRETD